MEELKRCPFCGSIPTTFVQITSMGGGTDAADFAVRCTECGTSKTIRLKIGPDCHFIDVEAAMSKAEAAWNRRAET